MVCTGWIPAFLAPYSGIGGHPPKPFGPPSHRPGPLVHNLPMRVRVLRECPWSPDLYLVKHSDLQGDDPLAQFAGTRIELRHRDAHAQETDCVWPVSEARLIVSRKRWRSTASLNVGKRFCPVRMASANRAYICPTLKGSPLGKS